MFSEAEGMVEYLMMNGIEQDRISLEDESTSMEESIQNNKVFMERPYNGIGIILRLEYFLIDFLGHGCINNGVLGEFFDSERLKIEFVGVNIRV